MNKTFTANDIEQLLGNRFCPPAWAFLPQVRNGTGYCKTARTADAIAMGLWPSRGLFLHGFEIKVHRGDWLNELKNPEKAEDIAQFCDYWWVTAPKDLVKLGELPANWGLMIPHGKTMKVVTEAIKLKTNPIDKLFLAAILRRAQEVITSDAVKRESFLAGEKRGQEYATEDFKYDQERYTELKKSVKEFEKISGVLINSWRDIEIDAKAVKMVLNGEHLKATEALNNLLKQSKEITRDIERGLGNENPQR